MTNKEMAEELRKIANALDMFPSSLFGRSDLEKWSGTLFGVSVDLRIQGAVLPEEYRRSHLS